MARPLRIEFPNALYHISSHGGGEDVFHADADRQAWLDILAQVCQRFNWRVYSYCLMGGHYDALVQTLDGNLSVGMRQLNGVYTQWVNRQYGRTGPVFQGRFKAIVVQQERYLLELSRDVVLNPVHARTVRDIAKWRWSSYPATMGDAPCPPWLAADALLKEFSAQKAAARRKYADYVRAGVGLPSVWQALRGQIYLGDDKFVAKMQKKYSAIEPADGLETPQAQRRTPRKPLEQYEKQAKGDRNAAIARAYASGTYSQVELAQYFELHYSTISRLIAHAEQSV